MSFAPASGRRIGGNTVLAVIASIVVVGPVDAVVPPPGIDVDVPVPPPGTTGAVVAAGAVVAVVVAAVDGVVVAPGAVEVVSPAAVDVVSPGTVVVVVDDSGGSIWTAHCFDTMSMPRAVQFSPG